MFGSGSDRAGSPVTGVGGAKSRHRSIPLPRKNYLSFTLVPVGSCTWICMVVGGNTMHFAREASSTFVEGEDGT